VPALIASAQDTITQSGAWAPEGREPWVIRARVMTPMVFCASLVPCASDTMPAEPIWPIRKPWLRARVVIARLIR
jgi:hypothetical protein